MDVVETKGLHKELKRKFIEGNAGFMSLVALALVLGLAFCIERIIYLTLSEINAKKFMADIDAHIERGDIEGAKNICRETRGQAKEHRQSRRPQVHREPRGAARLLLRLLYRQEVGAQRKLRPLHQQQPFRNRRDREVYRRIYQKKVRS